MRKVISVNLNGNAYQLDEDAYALLAAYLERAQAQLRANPDRAEIMADLELAIAEKCGRFLGPRKTVVAAAEIQQVIDEMGPVASPSDEAASAETKAGPGKSETAAGAPKRLYQVREGAMISGVCNGLAAYLGADATVVRLAFVALAFLTGGFWILVYLGMMFLVPFAETSEQRAAAYGVPFSAQELIDQAKKNYAELKDRKQWKWQWKMHQRQWREWQRTMRAQARGWNAATAPYRWHVVEAWPAFLAPLVGILELALFVLLGFAIYALVKTGAVFGWPLPAGIPLWAGILILVGFYAIIVSPLAAARHSWYFGQRGRMYPALSAVFEIWWLAVTVLIIWLAYLNVPAVHDFIGRLPALWRNLLHP